MEKYCQNFQRILIDKTTWGYDAVMRTRCKMWSCDYCASVNRRRIVARILHGVETLGGAWSFHTFTAPEWCRGYVRSAKLIRKAWPKLRKRLARMFGKHAYIRVWEPHKDGTWHLHLIANFEVPDQRTITRDDESTYNYSPSIKKHVTDSGFGYILDNQNIVATENTDTNGQGALVASYVAKYATKSNMSRDAGKGCATIRRIEFSRDFPQKEFDSKGDFEVKSGVYLDDIVDASERQRHVVDIETGEKITSDQFEHTYIYPPDLDEGRQSISDLIDQLVHGPLDSE